MITKGYFLPGLPHILLAPEQNPNWQKVNAAFDQVRKQVQASGARRILFYSTYWPSILGHQFQARPEPEWIHVDDQFHELGSIPYKFKVDSEFAELCKKKAEDRGLHSRTVDYHGFPIDTGTVVVNKLINPDNALSIGVVSSNIYSDRAETIVLGKSCRDAIEESAVPTICVAISSLSNRLHTKKVDPKEDRIHSLKDEEWNQKFIEFLSEGRLEDVSQLSRQFHREARVHKVTNFKPFWWLASTMGQNNSYQGEVLEYQAIYGTGAAVIGLTPSDEVAKDLEFDEDDTEFYRGNRNVLDTDTKDHLMQNAGGPDAADL